MKRLAYILAIASLAVLTSCRETVFTPRPTIPLVYSILQDSSSRQGVVKSYRSKGPDGSIAIIGSPDETELLAKCLLAADYVNNIDGALKPDLLPDFAGEQIDLILDPVNTPYTGFIPRHTDALRATAVELSVLAMDTLCRLNPYSADKLKPKSCAKIILFSSSMMAEWGQFDVDTLIQLAGGSPLTISPVQALLEEALMDGDKVNIGVWASAKVAQSGVYESIHSNLHSGSSLRVLTPNSGNDTGSKFRSILGQYRKAGYPLPMHVLLLDEFGADIPGIMAEADSIRAGFSEEDLSMAKALAADFKVVEATSAISRCCYRMLRRENLFTHNIAYPKYSIYRTEKDHDGTIVLVDLSSKSLTPAPVPVPVPAPVQSDSLNASADNTHRLYVSDND